MDEKWEIFAECNTLFMHRSWTGYGIYEVSFAEAGGGFGIAEAIVEADEDRYRARSDELECVMVELTIRSLLLDETITELRGLSQKLWGSYR